MIKEKLQNRGRKRRLKKERKEFLLGYSPKEWEGYRPQKNLIKVGVFGAVFGISLLIPFLTTPLTFLFGLIIKFKPLFFVT